MLVNTLHDNKNQVNVYFDGKLGRATKGKIIERKDNKILISFTSWWSDEKCVQWFNEERKGCWECENSNHWYYPDRETETYAREMLECLMFNYWYEYFGKKLIYNL